MNSKKINITIPEDNLNEIEQFCSKENISKSWLIREACAVYIADINKKREIERKRKDMEWAAMASKKLRNKSAGFEGKKKGSQIIRKFRDREQ